jgi:hypothetical protein
MELEKKRLPRKSQKKDGRNVILTRRVEKEK